jgi:sugar transferase EpsL
MSRRVVYSAVARGRDLILASAMLVVAAPVMAVVAVAVRLRMGGPVLFRQTRAGKGAAPFTIYKFRTMRDGRAPDGSLRSDEDRLTRLGRFLRACSLDELPQLVNVLRGQMSLVGPRPLYPSYVPLYTAEQARRLQVRPGLTGLAQVGGRNSLSWEEKFALDCSYVDRRSLLLDLEILARTGLILVRREGVSTPGHATAPMFTGSPADAVDLRDDRAPAPADPVRALPAGRDGSLPG